MINNRGNVKKQEITPELVERFNDISMREFGFDIDDDGHLFDMDLMTALTYKDKFLKYCDSEDRIVRPNEIELDLLQNNRLMNTLFGLFIDKYSQASGTYFNSTFQSASTYGKKGYMACTYVGKDGLVQEIRSNEYFNESVRIFNLICKINKSEMMYDFEMFDLLPIY